MPRIATDHREDAKKKIIAAALAVAADGGWESVTLDAIARTVGVTKPALYGYFRNREALLREVHFEIFRKISASLGPTLAKDRDIRKIIRNLADLIFSQQELYAPLFFQMPVYMLQDPTSEKEFMDTVDTCRHLLREALAGAQAEGQIVPEIGIDDATQTIVLLGLGIHVGYPLLRLDVETEKRIWITVVERLLLLRPGPEPGS